MPEYKNKKTTCNKKSTTKVLPLPTAAVVAEIVGVSESYVKKVRSAVRPDKSEKAAAVKYCNELLIARQKILLEDVAKIIHNKKKHNQ